MNDRMMQSKDGNVDSSKALDACLVVTEFYEIESERHVLSCRFGKDTNVEDADINFVNDKQPMAEVQLTPEHIILANEQQHYEQSKACWGQFVVFGLCASVDANRGRFEWAFVALFDQDVQTFTCSMLLNLNQLEQQLDK
ncbi:hypothetical protein Tco_1050289 [Tanacetum coccineum]